MGARGHRPYGHREGKQAEKRLALLDAVLCGLRDRPLAEIKVATLCEGVGVVEQTFFNTFGSKASVLVYFVSLWSVEMQWRMARANSPRAALEALFGASARQQQLWPWLMPEIITEQLRSRAKGLSSAPALTAADKLLRFPAMEGIEEFVPRPIEILVADQVSQAIEGGELLSDTDPARMTRHLVALFFGSTSAATSPGDIADLLTNGFSILWKTASKGDLS